ncbi:hypothetical protein NL676_011715 [Syzygium grande]|nr:hypothetical protein NL676_011715 [Syzygium grande]
MDRGDRRRRQRRRNVNGSRAAPRLSVGLAVDGPVGRRDREAAAAKDLEQRRQKAGATCCAGTFEAEERWTSLLLKNFKTSSLTFLQNVETSLGQSPSFWT